MGTATKEGYRERLSPRLGNPLALGVVVTKCAVLDSPNYNWRVLNPCSWRKNRPNCQLLYKNHPTGEPLCCSLSEPYTAVPPQVAHNLSWGDFSSGLCRFFAIFTQPIEVTPKPPSRNSPVKRVRSYLLGLSEQSRLEQVLHERRTNHEFWLPQALSRLSRYLKAVRSRKCLQFHQ